MAVAVLGIPGRVDSRIRRRSWLGTCGMSLYELGSGAGDLFLPSEKVIRLWVRENASFVRVAELYPVCVS